MKRLLKVYLDKPELAGVVLLVVLMAVFQVRSNSVFLSSENIRGVLGLLPEVGLVAIGVTILMIASEFDISVGSVFALSPHGHGGDHGGRCPLSGRGVSWATGGGADRLCQRQHHAALCHPLRHHHA